MLKYFESKVKGLHKEDFAVGPMQVPNDLRGSSFLVDDPQHKTTTPLPEVPNDTPAQASVNTIDECDDDDDGRPSNEYVLVSLPHGFSSIFDCISLLLNYFANIIFKI